MQFNIKVGKKEATVKVMLSSLYLVIYQGKEHMIAPENHGHKITWVLKTGTLPTATVKAIGKAIETFLHK